MFKKLWLVVALVGGVAACGDPGEPNPNRPCGDGVCRSGDGETVASCPDDCDQCGNDTCDVGETPQNCAMDCQAPVCDNDKVCDPGETTQNCAADCMPAMVCNNNGVCEENEQYDTCSADCAAKVRVQNSSSYAIYYLYLKRCTETAWGQNQLSPYILYSNQSFTLGGIPPGCWNFKANNSNFSLTWMSSAGVNLTKGQTFTWTLYN